MKKTIKAKTARRWIARNAWRISDVIQQGGKINKGDQRQITICRRSLGLVRL